MIKNINDIKKSRNYTKEQLKNAKSEVVKSALKIKQKALALKNQYQPKQ